MPAEKFTKKADTAKRKRQWQHVYESALARGASEASAIKQANAAVKKSHSKGKKKPKKKKKKKS